MSADQEFLLPTELKEEVPTQPRKPLWFKKSGLLHIALVIVYTTGSVLAIGWTKAHDQPSPHDANSPADKVIEFSSKPFTLGAGQSGHVYRGKPSSELDSTWHDLLEPINIRVSRTDLQRINQSSVALADGKGYLAQLGVYHELHCVKIFRHWVYREHYLPNISAEAVDDMILHIEHCLELFREATMCRGDTALTTFRWERGKPRPVAIFEADHQCINWQKLENWSRDHSVSNEMILAMQNPVL